ncbi:Lipoprotein-releasing system ATP-binding protein LolD [Paraburkholderia kirstenboschensis]|uniref:ABC transporter ATP-binding protein n=1 Tax=Paraburkholderia kirstenboschensis TaxID=1245436 RepID=UPI001918F3DA|nr:ATP-binding cassette domain-containing protein [Paraburkholderia kirstenboschensis]CAD6562171.1 Lipoprotein-releasing system ATP-binding protein LolD [Paraburkholderia kirstenboschensis]
MRDVLIEARSLSRTYRHGERQVVALAAASFVLNRGDRIALAGRSGSGKTTLLHLMAALDTPTSGVIDWPALGARDTLLPARISLVFQTPSLLEPLTVSENVALPLLIADAADPADRASGAKRAVAAALARFGLEALAQKLPEELSGGQMQRVAMARATVGRPLVILADEPTGQLDQATGQALLDALIAHLANTPTALVIATHDPAVSARMNTLWRMERGVLTEAGPTARQP